MINLKFTKNKTNPQTVSNYMNALEKAFVIEKAPRYDIKGKELLASTEKYYVADHSLMYVRKGYSLEYKLDMFLLKASDNPQKDDALVEMMIRLGKSFEMKVTQEGVETMEQFEKLKAMGCDVIQGYLYSKPLLTDDFQSFVNGTTDLEAVMKRNVEAPYKKPKYIDFLINK